MQENSQTAPYCGDPPLELARVLRRDPHGGFAGLFEGRRAGFSFNARVAIRSGVDCLGLRPGDEVLAPDYNCGSEIDPLVHAGLGVRLYPVDRSLVAEPAAIKGMISERTRAVYVTHYFGILQPRLAELRAMCDRHGLRLIEDCALSLLSGAAPAEGRTGDFSVFCFYKFAPLLGGGALVINAEDIPAAPDFDKPAPPRTVAKTLVRAGLTGLLGSTRTKALTRRLKGQAGAPDTAPAPEAGLEDMPGHYYFDPGLQGRRISGTTRAMLRSFPVAEIVAKRRENWALWREKLDGMAGVEMLTPELAQETCPLNMPVTLRNARQVAAALQADGIGVTRWWAGFNRNVDWADGSDAMEMKDTALSLPLHQYLGRAHVDFMADRLARALKAA